MIKSKATIRGAVSRFATSHDGKSSFAIKTVIPGDKTAEIFVSFSDKAIGDSLNMGDRLEIVGELTFRKKGDVLYLNMSADKVEPTTAADSIEGNLEFTGTVGKQIDMKSDKKGRKYLTFSAYSAEKIGNGFEYTWVRFVRFSDEREAFLQPKAKIRATGALEVSAYQDRIYLSCRLEQLSDRQPLPFQTNDSNLPF